MAFNRKFKTETWFMRLPSGEIEIAEAAALERAFRCGLADGRTPVLAVGGKVWTTLAEAAELETPPLSVFPDALETGEPAADLANGAQWHVRNEDDETQFRAATKRSRYAVLGIAIAAVLASTGLGVAWADSNGALTVPPQTDLHASGEPQPAASRNLRNAKDMEDVPHHSQRDLERLSKEQQRRLRELDLARRMRGDDKRDAKRIAAGKPIVIPYSEVSNDPFAKSVSAFDPLNGAL
jgi:hypothetical protein